MKHHDLALEIFFMLDGFHILTRNHIEISQNRDAIQQKVGQMIVEPRGQASTAKAGRSSSSHPSV